MLDKVVYFSGVHSSGKSTLIKDLAEKLPSEFVRYQKHLKSDLDHTYHRMVFRVARYWIEAQEMDTLAKESGKIVLGDRCIYDNISYGLGFKKLGWISSHDFDHHQKIFEDMFGADESSLGPGSTPRNVVHVCPPFQWVVERLNERWKHHPKKWREGNLDYLKTVMDSFPEVHVSEAKRRGYGCNLLSLTETGREERVRRVLDWMEESGIMEPRVCIREGGSR